MVSQDEFVRERESEKEFDATWRTGSGMKIPEGFPGFTTVTSFGTGLPLVPDIVSSNQSADFFYKFGNITVSSFNLEVLRGSQK